MEIDYRANAVHALNVLMKHDPKLHQAEKDIVTFVSKLLEKKLLLVEVTTGYAQNTITLKVEAWDSYK